MCPPVVSVFKKELMCMHSVQMNGPESPEEVVMAAWNCSDSLYGTFSKG